MAKPLTVDEFEEHLGVSIKGHAAVSELFSLFTSGGCTCLPGENQRVILHKDNEEWGHIRFHNGAVRVGIRIDL